MFFVYQGSPGNPSPHALQPYRASIPGSGACDVPTACHSGLHAAVAGGHVENQQGVSAFVVTLLLNLIVYMCMCMLYMCAHTCR